MKKILALMLILVCCFTFGACNKNSKKVVTIDSLYNENFSYDLTIQRNNEKINKLHFVAISGNTFCYYFSESYPEKIERRAKVSIKEIIRNFIDYDNIENLLVNPNTVVKQKGVNGLYCKVYNVNQKYTVYYNEQFDLIIKCIVGVGSGYYDFNNWEIINFQCVDDSLARGITLDFRNLEERYAQNNRNDFIGE